MARIEIVGFDTTIPAEATFRTYGIRAEQNKAGLDHPWAIIRISPDRSTPVRIGRDEYGRCRAIPITPILDPLGWRLNTTWYCKPTENAKLR